MPGNIVNNIAGPNSMANNTYRDVIGNKNDKSLSGPGNGSMYGIAGFMSYCLNVSSKQALNIDWKHKFTGWLTISLNSKVRVNIIFKIALTTFSSKTILKLSDSSIFLNFARL